MIRMRSSVTIIWKAREYRKSPTRYAGGVAEHLVGGVAPAAQRGAVDHIVVQQGGGVDELDDGGGVDMPVAGMAAGAGGQKHQQGAQPLAACINNVGRDLVDQRYLAVQTLLDDPVDGLKISSYQPTNLF